MVREGKPTTVYWLDNKLYLNITNMCSNNCFFCIRNFHTGVGGFNLKLPEEPTAERVMADLEEVSFTRKWTEAIFCGFGEPTERLDCLLDVARWLRRRYGKPFSIRVNTNGHGYVLNPRRQVARELKTAGVNRVSVSLNAQNESVYNEICRPKLKNAHAACLEFINLAKLELETEITAVAIPEVNIQEVENLAQELSVKFRVRPYIPGFW